VFAGILRALYEASRSTAGRRAANRNGCSAPHTS
jgi:hypothetical protein